MNPGPAERLLIELGVASPDDIDLEAIAHDQGCLVRYEPLDGCEARLVGVEARGIITVSSEVGPRRRRFSLAHELGHWHHHRGQAFVCRPKDIGERRPVELNTVNPERVADAYASDLLMPRFLFDPATRTMRAPSFEEIEAVAGGFDVSLTATALRLLRSNRFPMLLICHDQAGRRWAPRSLSVPREWSLRRELDDRSGAFEVLYGRRSRSSFRRVPASYWFTGRSAERHEVHEQAIKTSTGEVLCVLHLGDARMLTPDF